MMCALWEWLGADMGHGMEGGTLMQNDANALARELMERARLGESEAGESWHFMAWMRAGREARWQSRASLAMVTSVETMDT